LSQCLYHYHATPFHFPALSKKNKKKFTNLIQPGVCSFSTSSIRVKAHHGHPFIFLTVKCL
jgi:hypothetical protein